MKRTYIGHTKFIRLLERNPHLAVLWDAALEKQPNLRGMVHHIGELYPTDTINNHSSSVSNHSRWQGLCHNWTVLATVDPKDEDLKRFELSPSGALREIRSESGRTTIHTLKFDRDFSYKQCEEFIQSEWMVLEKDLMKTTRD